MKKITPTEGIPKNANGYGSEHSAADPWYRILVNRLRGSPHRSARDFPRQGSFRLLYERFCEILVLNDSTLELIADIEDLLGKPRRFSLASISRRIHKSAMDVFVMVKNVNQIAQNRHAGLYDSLARINNLLEKEMAPIPSAAGLRFVVPLEEIRAKDVQLVGSKMASLCEAGNVCGFAIPEGFAITTGAFLHFMNYGQLWDKCERLEAILELEDSQGFADACREVQSEILATPVSEDLAGAMFRAFEMHFPETDDLVAVRSSAVGEDASSSSHAGLYKTELNVDFSRLLDSYRAVLASAFSPAAVAYRFQRGITIADSFMAVGCVHMIRPQCAGILFSRPPDDVGADGIVVSAVKGIAAGLAAGDITAETHSVSVDRISEISESVLTQREMEELREAARRLENHFGCPQEVEWAIDEEGLRILQTRPMTIMEGKARIKGAIQTNLKPLLEGGFVACPGVGSGPVVFMGPEDDLSRFPEGGVLVARHSKPAYAQIMDRCSAIVTDVGSPTGHMSSLAREFGVPAIVGMEGATRLLKQGQLIVVDADACRIFDQNVPFQTPKVRAAANADSPALEKLRHISRWIAPLALTDPTSENFRPDCCRSLHDITRYVHEKVFEAMFHYGDIPAANDISSAKLQAKLPIRVEIFDVGGGLPPISQRPVAVRPEHVLSIPMKAFLEGLLDPRIRWDLPRPVSVRGFLSVLGESMAGRPADTGEIGRMSYAIISDCYMNFSTKAGYHFSTIDTYCGKSVNRNYVHFRFHGGAAVEERRRRRVRFISRILRAMDFMVQVKGDTLAARLDKYDAADIQSRLVSLGRLTLCARQLDMLMDSDSSAEIFASAFLAGEWHKF